MRWPPTAAAVWTAPVLAVALLLLLPAAALPGSIGIAELRYEESSEGLPDGRPGTANDSGWTGLRFADFNRDGWMDLAAIGRKGSGAEPYLGDGGHTWQHSAAGIQAHFTGRSDLRFGDVDLDGHLDIVESTGHIWLGDGQGGWVAALQDLPAEGEDVDLGDVDNDGDLDAVVVGHLQDGLRVFLNEGLLGWREASAGLPGQEGGHKVAFADVDRDGCLDVVASYWYDGGAWLGDCAGAWTAATAGLTGFQGWGVAAGDVDGDGHIDVVFGTFHGRDGADGVRVFRGDGAGAWTLHAMLNPDEVFGGVALDDVDGDGDLDLLAGENGGAAGQVGVHLFLNDGQGVLQEVLLGLPVQGTDDLEGLAFGDVDHNGLLDVGLPLYGPDGVQVWVEASDAAHPDVRVASPRGGEVWVGGGLRTIRWVASVPPGAAGAPGTVDLHLSLQGAEGPWENLAEGLPNSGAHLWRVPDDGDSAQAHVRVTMHLGDAHVAATHALPFTVAPLPLGGPGLVARPGSP